MCHLTDGRACTATPTPARAACVGPRESPPPSTPPTPPPFHNSHNPSSMQKANKADERKKQKASQKQYLQYLALAKKGNPEACFMVSEHLSTGLGTPTGLPADVAKAEGMAWLQKAANLGHADAQVTFGHLRLQSSPETAVSWYRKAALQGHGKAAIMLGSAYRKGPGVKQDFAEAAKFYRQAMDARGTQAGGRESQRTAVRATLNLASIYNTEGGLQDHAEAFRLFVMYTNADSEALSAEEPSRLGEAHCRIAYCYMGGEGVEQDMGKGVEHLLIAADAGHVQSMEACGVEFRRRGDWEEAVAWFTKAARAGSCYGRVSLAW